MSATTANTATKIDEQLVFLGSIMHDMHVIARRVPWSEYKEMQKIVEKIRHQVFELQQQLLNERLQEE